MALLLTSVFGVTGCGSDDDVAVESRVKNKSSNEMEGGTLFPADTYSEWCESSEEADGDLNCKSLVSGTASVKTATVPPAPEASGASDVPSEADCALLFLVESDLRDLLNSLALSLSANPRNSLGVLFYVDSDLLRGLLNSLTRLDNDDLDALLDRLDSLALRDLRDVLLTAAEKKSMVGDTSSSRAARDRFRNRFDSLDLRNRLDLDDLRNFLSQCDAASDSGIGADDESDSGDAIDDESDSGTAIDDDMPSAPATEPEGDDVDEG